MYADVARLVERLKTTRLSTQTLLFRASPRATAALAQRHARAHNVRERAHARDGAPDGADDANIGADDVIDPRHRNARTSSVYDVARPRERGCASRSARQATACVERWGLGPARSRPSRRRGARGRGRGLVCKDIRGERSNADDAGDGHALVPWRRWKHG